MRQQVEKCLEHRLDQSRAARRRLLLRRLGRCESCGALSPAPRCHDCRDLLERFARDQRAREVQYSRSWQARMRHEGRCVQCGRKSAKRQRGSRCRKCAGPVNERKKERYRAKNPAARRRSCSLCGAIGFSRRTHPHHYGLADAAA